VLGGRDDAMCNLQNHTIPVVQLINDHMSILHLEKMFVKLVSEQEAYAAYLAKSAFMPCAEAFC
jgi:arginine/ornithine N-succinyltransferase beta subunit